MFLFQKSLWDTLKKKNSSGTSAIKVKKSTLEIKNVNKTFQVSQKVDIFRNPLQSCENQNTVQNSVSQGNDPLAGSENQLPPSPIAPVPEENGNTVHTPVALRRSTTFGDIVASGNKELLPKIDICNINKSVTEHNQVEPQIASSSAGLAQLPMSSDGEVLNFTLSPVSTPEHSASAPVLINTRRILSPDAFVNDNYQADIDVIEQPFPILSPDQFVKDSLSDKPSKTPKPEAALVSSTTETYVVKRFLPSKWKKDAAMETETRVHTEHSLKEVLELHNVKSQVFDSNKPKEDPCSFPSAEQLQPDNPQRGQTKKRPILSVTVTKSKPSATEETRTETCQPKSKKCLNKAIIGCANVPGHVEAETSKHLPVIAPISSENKCHNDKVNSSTGSTTSCRKRKSETCVGNSRVPAPVHVEEVERKRALTSSMSNQTHIIRPSAFISSGERVGQRRKAGE